MSNKREELLNRCRLESALESQGIYPEQVQNVSEADDKGRKARLQAIAWHDENELRPIEEEMAEVNQEWSQLADDDPARNELKEAYDQLMAGWRVKCKQRERAANKALVDGFFQTAKPKSPPVLDPRNGVILFCDGTSLSLEANEQAVLSVLVKRHATTLSVLRLESSCDNPDRVLKRLRDKDRRLKASIKLPGGKGKGGYSTTIKLAE